MLKIILVVATLRASRNSVRISISVGKVVRSVGFGIYSDISKIRTANAIDIVKNRSSRDDGRGTIIMAKIAITNATTLRSFCEIKKFSVVPTCCLNVSFLANF